MFPWGEPWQLWEAGWELAAAALGIGMQVKPLELAWGCGTKPGQDHGCLGSQAKSSLGVEPECTSFPR